MFFLIKFKCFLLKKLKVDFDSMDTSADRQKRPLSSESSEEDEQETFFKKHKSELELEKKDGMAIGMDVDKALKAPLTSEKLDSKHDSKKKDKQAKLDDEDEDEEKDKDKEKENEKDKDKDEDEDDDKDEDEGEEQEDSDDEQGYDEEGKEGEWTYPQNRGGSVWLTNKKKMCRVVDTNGRYMDLPKKKLDKETIIKYLGTSDVQNGLHPFCKRGRYMIHRADMLSLKAINKKAAACIYQDVRGNVIFCEGEFL